MTEGKGEWWVGGGYAGMVLTMMIVMIGMREGKRKREGNNGREMGYWRGRRAANEDRGIGRYGKKEKRRGGDEVFVRREAGGERATQHQSFAPPDLMIVFIGKDSRREN